MLASGGVMANAKRRKRPAVLLNGRNKFGPRHVRIHHWEMDCPAWKQMSVYGRALVIELRSRFNGGNNGEIHLSVREAAKALNCHRDTAAKALRDVEAKGWVQTNQKGSFDWKGGAATTFILANEQMGDKSATKNFMSWKPAPENTKAGTTKPAHVAQNGTTKPDHVPISEPENDPYGTTRPDHEGQIQPPHGTTKPATYSLPGSGPLRRACKQ
jgi:hypothetical protein